MKEKSSKINLKLCFWLTLSSITIFRLIIAGKFGFSTDESHYVLYSMNPALGYFDHPPMVGLFGAFTTLFGSSAFFYRLGPILCWSTSVVLLRALILTLYKDEKVAFLTLILLPGHDVNSTGSW